MLARALSVVNERHPPLEWRWVRPTAMASAASCAGSLARPSRRVTMYTICCFSARPWPTIAD